MIRQSCNDRTRGRRRSRPRPAPEALEPRQMLATVPITVAMDPKANGMIGGVAIAHVLVIGGRATPGAEVDLRVGQAHRQGHADRSGQYLFRLPMPAGTYPVRVESVAPDGDASTASMIATRGDAVIAWDATMTDEVIPGDVANVGLASRTLAMVSAAAYDAVNDVDRTGAVYKVDVRAPKGASAAAAASEASYKVFSALEPSMQPLLDARMAQSLAAIPAGRSRLEGIAVGDGVARGILAWRANDGSSATVPYVAGSAPGQWRPTPPTFQTAWGPEWGSVAPFAISKPASRFEPPPPPALGSPEYAAALNQVESLGALDSTTRTPDQTQAGLFWSYDATSTGTPPVLYDQIARTVALQEHNSLDQDARLFGLVNVAMADAGIAAWTAKYSFNFWRPITAIRLADTDGNPATVADPTWTPLGSPGNPGKPPFTPPFPGYVSGHATFGAALFTVLTHFYGTDKIHFTVSSVETPGVTRSFASFGQASLENALSRVYLGVHFVFDSTEGLAVGDSIGRDVYAHTMTTPGRTR